MWRWNHCVTNCSAHKLSSIDTVPCLTLSNGVNNRTRYISRWSVKCGQSCLVRVKWKNYVVGKQTVSAPPQSLRKIFKKFPIRQLWVVGKGAVEFTCTAFYISSMHTKQTTSKKILNLANLLSAVVSGVIFQVIGVFSWTEVNHIRMSSSWRFCSISFFFKVHSNNSWS